MKIELKDVEIKKVYRIVLMKPSKHVGGIEHQATYSCGFWHDLQGKLIALHRDVYSIHTIDNHTALHPAPPVL